MALIGRSIPRRFLVAALGLIFVSADAPLAFAQHPYGHAPGGPAHVSAAPVYHAPISSGPSYRAPIPRMSAFRSAGVGAGASFIPPRRPIRRYPPVLLFYGFPFAFGSPFFWGSNCWTASCDLFWSGTVDYSTFSSPGPVSYVAPAYEAPVFDFDYGQESADTPQLYLKDGSVLNVRDYWLIDDQLHFTIIQEYGAEPVEQSIPLEALDLQKTVDVDTRRGFHFMLRNEPFDQYVRDHPDGAPAAVTPPQ
jgi:hypothetical protein